MSDPITHVSLAEYDIEVEEILRNLSPAVLYEHASKHDSTAAIMSSGALRCGSGEKTGRSPADSAS